MCRTEVGRVPGGEDNTEMKIKVRKTESKAPMNAWLEKAPLRKNPIDDPTPWAAPYSVTGRGGKAITDDKSKIVNISKTNFAL